MMVNIFVFVNVIIFIFLSLLHFYWAFGGKWAIDATVPEKWLDDYTNPENKWKNVTATLIVAIGLLFFAFVIGLNVNLVSVDLSAKMVKWITGGIGGIFLLRAVGDMNMFGFFKKKSESKFSKNDSLIYSPLCLFIGAICFAIIFIG